MCDGTGEPTLTHPKETREEPGATEVRMFGGGFNENEPPPIDSRD